MATQIKRDVAWGALLMRVHCIFFVKEKKASRQGSLGKTGAVRERLCGGLQKKGRSVQVILCAKGSKELTDNVNPDERNGGNACKDYTVAKSGHSRARAICDLLADQG